MKKKTFFFKIAATMIFSASVFYLYSCKKEKVIENTVLQEKVPVVKKVTAVNGSGARTCQRPVCFTEWKCNGTPSGCIALTRFCTDLVLCIDLIIPKCVLVDCGPSDYIGMFNKDPNPIPRLVDYLKGDPSPQPSLGFISYGVTERIVWLQFYSPIKNVLDEKVFNLNKSIVLDKQNTYLQGLKGNIIPAGNYPVVFDAKSKTYNAIAVVQ
jgi:hypothetical protein